MVNVSDMVCPKLSSGICGIDNLPCPMSFFHKMGAIKCSGPIRPKQITVSKSFSKSSKKITKKVINSKVKKSSKKAKKARRAKR